jgi:hypothetical protein
MPLRWIICCLTEYHDDDHEMLMAVLDSKWFPDSGRRQRFDVRGSWKSSGDKSY